MEDKRYDIVCKKARKRIKGIECILYMVDAGGDFHDSVIERFEFDADKELLIMDVGDVWAADQDRCFIALNGVVCLAKIHYCGSLSKTIPLRTLRLHRYSPYVINFQSPQY